MYQLLEAPVKRRLVLQSGPVGQLHDFALLYWFRRWLSEEEYLGCAAVRRELRRREALGTLRVAQLVDGLRCPASGRPDLAGLHGLLDTWLLVYPTLFSRRAARTWLAKRRRPLVSWV